MLYSFIIFITFIQLWCWTNAFPNERNLSSVFIAQPFTFFLYVVNRFCPMGQFCQRPGWKLRYKFFFKLKFYFFINIKLQITGITISANRSLLLIWCMFSSFATAASTIVQQPLYNSTLNEFDTTATMTTANAIVAIFLMAWSLARSYEYVTCFETAAILQAVTAAVFLASSFRRRRWFLNGLKVTSS